MRHPQQMRHLIDPPAGRAFIQQQARMKYLVDPATRHWPTSGTRLRLPSTVLQFERSSEQNETISLKPQEGSSIPKFEPTIPARTRQGNAVALDVRRRVR